MAVTITTKKKVSKPKKLGKTARKTPAKKATTTTKKKTETKAKTDNKFADLSTEELVDMGGSLQEQATVFANTVLSDLKAVSEELQERAMEDLPSEASHVYLGKKFVAKVGKEGTSRSITDMVGIAKKMGEELFIKLAKVTLTDIDKYLTPDQIKGLVKSEKTGKRSLKFEKNE